VRLKWFLSLWYTWSKPSTYLASRLTLSPNGPKRASTWLTSPRSIIGCAWKDFHECGTFSANLPLGAPEKVSMPVVHSAQTVHVSCAEINAISKWTETSFHLTHITLEYHRVRQKWFPSLWSIRSKLCTYVAQRLILSPNRPKQASTGHTLPRSTIRWAQSHFQDHGIFGANHASTLRRD
jgi:hypothetical protein